MIWTDVIQEYPESAYIHPLYDGQGTVNRKYRPVWHAHQVATDPNTPT